MKRFKTLSKYLSFFFVELFLLSSCQNVDEYRRERVAKADRTFRDIKSKNIPEDAILSLPFCIQEALKNNLNLRVYELKEAVNREQKTAAALGMLPNVVVTNDISIRNNDPGASSYSLLSGDESLEPSQSAQKWENRFRIEFLFSFIDFGLAYFNAVQGRDRTLITAEQKRRATQNLILDVSRAYFKVAAAQYAMENTEKMLAIADDTEKLLEGMVKNRRLPLEKILVEKKTFLVLKKSLMEYKRNYENSCIELRSLMGYYPASEIIVDTRAMKDIPVLKVPEIELLEEIALLERPELYQLDMQRHITAVAAKKKIIEMFPNVGIFTDFTNSSNKYLYHQSWWEFGARAAYRLLRVPQQIGEYVAIESEIKQIEMQVAALSIGIVSQVRIAHANLDEVKHRYTIARELYDTYLQHEQVKEKQANTAGTLSKVELNRIKMETAQKDIERTQALGNYYLAYFRLLNSVGLENMDASVLETIKERIKETFGEVEEDEVERIAECRAEISELQTEIDKCNSVLNEYEAIIVNRTQEINDTDQSIINMRSNLSDKQRSEKLSFEETISGLKGELAQNTAELEGAKKNLEDIKIKYHSDLRKAELEYEETKSHLDEKIAASTSEETTEELEERREIIEENYEEYQATLEKEYEKEVNSLEIQIAFLYENAEGYVDSIEEEEERIEDTLSDVHDEHQDMVEDLADKKDSYLEEFDEHKELIAEYTAKLEKLEAERNAIEEEMQESIDIIEEHERKLSRYISAIDLLNEKDGNEIIGLQQTEDQIDKTLSMVSEDTPEEQVKRVLGYKIDIANEYGMKVSRYISVDLLTVKEHAMLVAKNEAVKAAIKHPGALDEFGKGILAEGSAPEQVGESTTTPLVAPLTPDANITMQAQRQSGNNTIPFEEFSPEATKNINMQTQRSAGNNEINIEGYNPETQNDILVQTMRESGNNEINFEEYSRQLNTGDPEDIGDPSMNKSIEEQLSIPLTD